MVPIPALFWTQDNARRNHPFRRGERCIASNVMTAQSPKQRRNRMDWNRVEGNWKQVKGKVKEKWGKLTDDDLDVINGRRDQLEGKIQERYGIAKDQAKKDIDTWYGAQRW
jgi:uncharacterized protein YjbJ (UPF0337 family)